MHSSFLLTRFFRTKQFSRKVLFLLLKQQTKSNMLHVVIALEHSTLVSNVTSVLVQVVSFAIVVEDIMVK